MPRRNTTQHHDSTRAPHRRAKTTRRVSNGITPGRCLVVLSSRASSSSSCCRGILYAASEIATPPIRASEVA